MKTAGGSSIDFNDPQIRSQMVLAVIGVMAGSQTLGKCRIKRHHPAGVVNNKLKLENHPC
jgi:hypothetical protein